VSYMGGRFRNPYARLELNGEPSHHHASAHQRRTTPQPPSAKIAVVRNGGIPTNDHARSTRAGAISSERTLQLSQ
jgi:hypothetical protein